MKRTMKRTYRVQLSVERWDAENQVCLGVQPGYYDCVLETEDMNEAAVLFHALKTRAGLIVDEEWDQTLEDRDGEQAQEDRALFLTMELGPWKVEDMTADGRFPTIHALEELTFEDGDNVERGFREELVKLLTEKIYPKEEGQQR